MPIKKSANIHTIESKLRSYFNKLPRTVGLMSVEFFKESFKEEGFRDHGLVKWRARKPGAVRNQGRGILTNTARLRRSGRILAVYPGSVIVVFDAPYAGIHNTGGQIRRQVTVKTHGRRKHRRVVDGESQDVKESIVFRHQRKMNTFIPRRRFIGNSFTLNKRIANRVINDLRKIL